LVTLAKESDTVLAALLGLAGRHQHMAGVELLTIRNGLWTALQVIDDLIRADPSRRDHNAGAEHREIHH
jgi:hypothetical protein